MNVIQPHLPSGFVTYCDDVRYETNGKISLIGIYAGEMTVFGAAPALVPALWAVIRWRVPELSEPTEITIRLSKEKDGDDAPEVLGEATFPLPAADKTLDLAPEEGKPRPFKMGEVHAHMRVSPLPIEGPCTLRVRVFYQGDEYRIGAMNVLVAPLPEEPASE